MSELAKVWGKLDSGSGARQPLLAHLCDVAAVLEGIVGAPLFRKRFERLAGEDFSGDAARWFGGLAFCHDLGKVSPRFQIISQGYGDKAVGHVRAAWNLFGVRNAALLRDTLLASGCFGDSEDEQEAALYAILSHHGGACAEEEFLSAVYNTPPCWERIPEVDLDPAAALGELVDFARKHFVCACSRDETLSGDPRAQHLFSGMLMLADWIASDRRFFPFCGETDWLGACRPSLDEETALEWSRAQAKKVLSHLRWDMDEFRPAALPDFEAQFGFAPNGIQKAVDGLELSPDGGLYVLEAETGSGKTEAALRLYTRLLCAGLADGLYFANPLRFAATQLYERMNVFSGQTFGADGAGKATLPVTLAVPGYLRAGGAEGVRTGRFSVDWGKELGDDALGWFAENSKRYLAAPLASGTIDQALLAGLRVPHADMRAAALQRSLLVVDEVHSSDAYMSELICALLKIFKAVGGHVLLMSATLGSESLAVFRCAWEGGGADLPALEEAVRVGYPRLVSDTQAGLRVDAPARPKRVTMQPERMMTDADAVAALAQRFLAGRSGEDAPCILILRNSVRQARKTFRALRRCLPRELIFDVNGVCSLHHSRFAPEDRRLLDKEVERRFGKHYLHGTRTCAPRKGCVLVSTQTVEQSLDVDFDLLITDLCPADVLLQRIGRLFRHDRARPVGFDTPRCVVLTPEGGADWLLSRQAKAWGFGSDRAYEPLCAAATLFQIGDGCTWRLPDQNRELVEGCTHRSLCRRWFSGLAPTDGSRP
ncbi:MAG: CRISPR-associated helicase Cas3' [Pyramidobacter sp.]|nr:CRISPR-associated helicase Cas3' [Pyramidobacter sp.]